MNIENDEKVTIKRLSEKVIEKSQDELTKWFKNWINKKFWIITIIICVVGYFGIEAIIENKVRDQLDEYQKKIVIAEIEIEDTHKKISNYVNEIDSIMTTFDSLDVGNEFDTDASLTNNLKSLNTRLDSLRKSIAEAKVEFNKVSKNDYAKLLNSVKSIEQRISELEINVNSPEETYLKYSNITVYLIYNMENTDYHYLELDTYSSQLRSLGFNVTIDRGGGNPGYFVPVERKTDEGISAVAFGSNVDEMSQSRILHIITDQWNLLKISPPHKIITLKDSNNLNSERIWKDMPSNEVWIWFDTKRTIQVPVSN